MESSLFEDRSKFKYMLFSWYELYGTPLLQVREVIENRPSKSVPNATPAFEGVINLRGEVIGIVDLRKMLKVEPIQSLSILVFDSSQGFLGAVVDKCVSVAEIPEKDIDKGASQTGANYFIGIGKREGGLVTLIDLTKITSLMESQK